MQAEILKQRTNMITVPTSLARQLAVPLCRLTHGCSFLTVGDLFGVPNSLVV